MTERTLREIYLRGFEIAVREGGAKGLMTSYNKINGVYANNSKDLLTHVLRQECLTRRDLNRCAGHVLEATQNACVSIDGKKGSN